MNTGPNLNPQHGDRDGLRRLFVFAATRLGGIAADDLPSFERAPLEIDWVKAVRGTTFQEGVISYVRKNLEFFPIETAQLLQEIASMGPRMFDRILKAACVDRDDRIVSSLPNFLLMASQVIEDQASGEINIFGRNLYLQANAIYNSNLSAGLAEDGLGTSVKVISGDTPRFPED